MIIFSTSLFTVPLGSRIAHRLNAALLRRNIWFFLLLSALNILRGVVWAMSGSQTQRWNNSLATRAIIFDMDGLLLDSETLSYETYVETADRYGITAGFDSYSRMIGLNMIEGVNVLRDILPARIDAATFKAEWVAQYRERLAGTVPVKPGVVDVINRLAARNIPMAVATSSQGEKARDVLDRAGLAAHMLAITGGNEVARGKPAPDVYLASIEKLVTVGGITGADDCVAFEDSEVGVRAALAAGLRVIQIPDLVPAAKPSSPPFHLIADTLATGIGWLKIDA